MRRVSGVMLTLLLVGMWPLSFGSQPAPTQQVSELLLYSDKDIYVLQENITIVVENIGNKTVNWVGRCPVPWDIFTYPDEECVFTAFPCFCIFDLAPGENVTYVWNQCDFFTIGSVEPGMYVVRDNQGWGLMAYFKIVDTEIVVPYDYATIQEAINNANEGDIIFVGKGTYYEHVELYKSVSLVGEDRRTTIVEGYYTHRSTVNITANYAKVAGFTIRNTHQPETPPFLGWGVEVGPSTGVVIEGNMFSELAYGVCAECSKLLAINDNEMTTIGNVFPVGSVPTLMVSDDVMTTPFEAAIRLNDHCSNGTIERNSFADCSFGVLLANSSQNTFRENSFSTCGFAVALAVNSRQNIFCHNEFIRNTYGICFGGIHDSRQNTFYHNNFITNAFSVTFESSTNQPANTWDNGCEGNYWSDYEGLDSNHDGIGDTSYVINTNNTDNYPLTNPYWNPADINHDLEVNIYDVVSICVAYNSTPLDPNWNCHCDIREPYGVIDIYDTVAVCNEYGEEWNP